MTGADRNLVVRILTVAVLLPGVLWLLWLGGLPFALLVSTAAALAAWELNELPDQSPAQALPLRERARGAELASIAAAFLLPLTEGLDVHGFTARGILTALVMVAFADALLFEPDLPRAPQRVALAVLGAVYPGLLLGTVVRLRQLPDGP